MTSLLHADQLDAWRRHGWLHLEGILTPAETDALDTAACEVAGWAEEHPPRGLHHREMTDGGPVLARSEHFADDHGLLGGFLRDGVVPALVAELFGEPAVLFKEKINYKHPGGGGFAAHQDAAAYRFADRHISVMVALDAATVANGCLWFASNPADGLLPNDAGRIHDDVADTLAWRPVEVRPGDVVLFDSFAPHRSGTNGGSTSRRAFYLTYNAASDGDLRQQYYEDKLAELAALAGGAADGSGRVRLSISDDFLGRPVTTGGS